MNGNHNKKQMHDKPYHFIALTTANLLKIVL